MPDQAPCVALDSVVVAGKDQASCDLDGEAIVFSTRSGVYFGLNGSAGLVWRLIQEPRSVAEVRDAILEEYDVDTGRCEQDLLRLLNELVERGLADVVAPAAA